MNREEAIKKWKNLYDVWDTANMLFGGLDNKFKKNSKSDLELLDFTIKELEQQRWIPCDEKLPKEDQEVFVYLWDRPSPYIAWMCGGHWCTEDFELDHEDAPAAWMPLPEPYGGLNDDKSH